MSLPKTLSLRSVNGSTVEIPSVGFGTWAAERDGWAKDATLAALKAGYRHLDCAWLYGVDKEVGEAIRESGIPRSEIFITSKFWTHFNSPENVEVCLDIILKQMGLDYLDLYLMHWPISTKAVSKEALRIAEARGENDGMLKVDGKLVVNWELSSSSIAKKAGKQGSLVPTWQTMKGLVRKGKVRNIGVSNFSVADLEGIIPEAQDIPISCNQIEVHPWLPQNELVAYGKKHGILTTCYCPFGGAKKGTALRDDQTLNELAKKKKMGIGQLLQSWAVTRGTIPLGKSATPSRIKSNLDVQKLSKEDMDIIATVAKPGDTGRMVNFTEEWRVSLF